jgi:hypothetical protein
MSTATCLERAAVRSSVSPVRTLPCHAASAMPVSHHAHAGSSRGDSNLAISDAFVADILKPYRPNVRYLKSAEIDLVRRDEPAWRRAVRTGLLTGTGRFAIGDSCYIDDTGHFNAVEFNICYNQLAYVLFAKCIEGRHVPELSFLDFAEFKRQQLPSWLIVGIEDVRFTRQLCRREFTGVLSVDRMSKVRSTRFFFTTIAFADREGVKASGAVVLAYSHSECGADR